MAKAVRAASLAGVPLGALLSSCDSEELGEALRSACPSPVDTAAAGRYYVSWTPDLTHPIFYGYHEGNTRHGPVRIWFPSTDGSPSAAKVHPPCLSRYPVVLFLHGNSPCEQEAAYAGSWYRKWESLPRNLARSGYVVIVPRINWGSHPLAEGSQQVTEALAALTYAREAWEDRWTLSTRPEDFVIAGHSYGALLGHAVARTHQPAAYLSLSGVWKDVPGSDPQVYLSQIRYPSMFMWGYGDDAQADLIAPREASSAVWDTVGTPKYLVADPTLEHHDYIDRPEVPSGCARPGGPCEREQILAELSTLFIGRYVRPALSRASVAADLTPTEPRLNEREQFYAGGHFYATKVRYRQGSGDCPLTIRWWLQDGTTGTRTLALAS